MNDRIDDGAPVGHARLAALEPAARTRLVGRLERALRKARLLDFPGRSPHPIALTPLALGERTAHKMARLARTVARCMAALPALWLDGHPLVRQSFRFGSRTRRWLERAAPIAGDDLLVRLDFGIAADSGRPVLFEANSTGAVGIFNHTVGLAVLRDVGAPLDLGALHSPPDLVSLHARYLEGRSPRAAPRVGLLLEPAEFETGSERIELARLLRRRFGLQLRWGSLDQLEARAGRVFLAGRSCDLIERDLSYQVIPVGHAGFRNALLCGAVAPGPAAEFDAKGLLECLAAPELTRRVPRNERTLLATMVPWTRVIFPRRTEGLDGRAGPLDRHLERDREALVIKPNAGLSGAELLLGRFATAGRWRRRIERAFREPGKWVAQRYVEVAPHPGAWLRDGEIHLGPCHAAFGLFHSPAGWGLHARISPDAAVNVATGGALAVVLLSLGD